MDNMSMFTTPNQFTFSAVEIDKLGATEYTLVNILVDASGSVSAFKSELEACLGTVVEACKKHPRSGNLLVRVASFSEGMGRPAVVEIHGFNLLTAIDPSVYNIRTSGNTPLYDATLDAIETTKAYAQTLMGQDYFCNSIFFVLTDGWENASHVATIGKIKDGMADLRRNEVVESTKAILIGVNDQEARMKDYLDNFKTDAAFDEYVSIGDATPGKLAKLAEWVSRSISSTSQALGTGGPSQAVNFVL